ncbi:MAG: 4Fe-4S binding protein [Desulfobacteraceae bacterium]
MDQGLCIGCGFCAGACPCGVWDLVENTPLESDIGSGLANFEA